MSEQNPFGGMSGQYAATVQYGTPQQAGTNGAEGTGNAGMVKDTTTAKFAADVIQESRRQPVLVDFWAPWCGPCKQLAPLLEKAVKAAGGRVRLVKMNIDEHPAIAGQLGIQSIPAVFAFAGGRPVDAFMGAIPESEVRRFAERVIAQAPAAAPEPGSLEEQIATALEAANAALVAGDFARAGEIYNLVLQHVPDKADALLGLAQVHIAGDQLDEARALLEQVPEDARKGEEYVALSTALKLAAEAEGLGDTAALEIRVAANPDDHQARFDLAVVLNAQGKRIEAAEALLAIMRRDRAWDEDGARRKLLELFEAWGPKDPATLKGRRMLSSLLFS